MTQQKHWSLKVLRTILVLLFAAVVIAGSLYADEVITLFRQNHQTISGIPLTELKKTTSQVPHEIWQNATPPQGLGSGGSAGVTSQPTTCGAGSTGGFADSANIRQESINWAGYIATGGNYTAVSGAWTIPSFSGNVGNVDATWVGIGGSANNQQDLIQMGTENQVLANGRKVSLLFYEALPEEAQIVSSVAVNPGDTVSTSIVETSTNLWTLTFVDQTNGGHFTTTVSYQSQNNSAEWIEEDPLDANSRSLIPITCFGAVQFSGASATVNGSSRNLSALGAQAIEMTDTSYDSILAIPSGVVGGGSFRVRQL